MPCAKSEQQLQQTEQVKITPKEIRELLSGRGGWTNLQRETMLDQISSKSVVWEVPVENIDSTNDKYRYRVHAVSGKRLYGNNRHSSSFDILLDVCSEPHRQLLSKVREYDTIRVKGIVVIDARRESFTLEPAMLF